MEPGKQPDAQPGTPPPQDGQGRRPQGEAGNKRTDGQPGRPHDGQQPNTTPAGPPPAIKPPEAPPTGTIQPDGVPPDRPSDGQPNKRRDRQEHKNQPTGLPLDTPPDERHPNNRLHPDPERRQPLDRQPSDRQPSDRRQQDSQSGRYDREPVMPDEIHPQDRSRGEFRPHQPDATRQRPSGIDPQTQRPFSSGGGGQRTREVAIQPVPISPTTSIIRQPDQSALTIQHRHSNGTETRVISRIQPNGRQKVTAYQNVKDPKTKIRTRVYNDGRRVVFGKDFVTRTTPGRPTMTTFSNGLREAVLPDRKRYFKDAFSTSRDHRGHERKVIHRTFYAHYSAGRTVELPKPIIRIYEETPIQNIVVYAYRPTPFIATYYTVLEEPFLIPLEIGHSCLICPPPMLTYVEPVHSYATPMDLLVDMLLAGAVYDSQNTLVMETTAPDAEVNALSATVASLQQELESATATNETLRMELTDQENHPLEALQSQLASKPVDEKIPMPIPEPVRKQFRQQVEQDLVAHQNSQPLSLANLLTSTEAQDYIFQVAENMEATEIVSGEECMLTTGDLVRIDEPPQPKDASARMRVVTSQMESCRVNSVVNISLWNLQEMLNAYRQRLEENLQKVHQKVSEKGQNG
ncbi:MAG: hypothetical protein HQL99_07360 [Magnetococcales bacterium]|nr:hypothetical protein [Magnetococcales bacterium]